MGKLTQNLNFQPYVRKYVGNTLNEVQGNLETRRQNYDTATDAYDKLEMAASALDVTDNDYAIKKERLDKIKDTINKVTADDGAWERAHSIIRKEARDFAGDDVLKRAAVNKQSIDAMYKRQQELGTSSLYFGEDPTKFNTRTIDPTTGKEVLNDFRGTPEQMLDWDKRGEEMFNNMVADASNIGLSQSALEGYLQSGMTGGISDPKIKRIADLAVERFERTPEGQQMMTKLMSDNYDKIPTKDLARKEMLKMLYSAGKEREHKVTNMDYQFNQMAAEQRNIKRAAEKEQEAKVFTVVPTDTKDVTVTKDGLVEQMKTADTGLLSTGYNIKTNVASIMNITGHGTLSNGAQISELLEKRAKGIPLSDEEKQIITPTLTVLNQRASEDPKVHKIAADLFTNSNEYNNLASKKKYAETAFESMKEQIDPKVKSKIDKSFEDVFSKIPAESKQKAKAIFNNYLTEVSKVGFSAMDMVNMGDASQLRFKLKKELEKIGIKPYGDNLKFNRELDLLIKNSADDFKDGLEKSFEKGYNTKMQVVDSSGTDHTKIMEHYKGFFENQLTNFTTLDGRTIQGSVMKNEMIGTKKLNDVKINTEMVDGKPTFTLTYVDPEKPNDPSSFTGTIDGAVPTAQMEKMAVEMIQNAQLEKHSPKVRKELESVGMSWLGYSMVGESMKGFKMHMMEEGKPVTIEPNVNGEDVPLTITKINEGIYTVGLKDNPASKVTIRNEQELMYQLAKLKLNK